MFINTQEEKVKKVKMLLNATSFPESLLEEDRDPGNEVAI